MSEGDKNGGPVSLKAWREHRKLSQTTLAELVNTNANMISYLETGKRGLTVDWMRKLGRALGVRPSMLIDDKPGDVAHLPNEQELAGMLRRAMMELPPGVSYADFPEAVASSLRERLELYQDVGGYQDCEGIESGLDIAAGSDPTTTTDALVE